MVKRKHSVEQIIGQLRDEAEVELAQGRSVAEVCRSLGVTEQTYYPADRWRKEYGGLKMDQAWNRDARGSIRSNRLSASFERPKWNLPRVAA